MRAIGVTHFGGPEVLETIELPRPEPGPREVRIRVHAAGVNPVDRLWRNGYLAKRLAVEPAPYIPGMDAAGVVDAVGEDVGDELGLSPGSRVVAIVDNHGQHGAYSDFLVLPVESVVPAPSRSTHAEAASFLMPALTVREALDHLELPAGSTVLITGAAGGVGQQAVALAHLDGYRVVALASTGDETLVRRLGADEFVARNDDAMARIREVSDGGVDGVIDAANLHADVPEAVRDGGRIIVVSRWAPGLDRGISVVHVDVRHRARDREAIGALRDLAAEGVLPMTVALTYPADEVVAAHHRFDHGGLRGRIILLFADA
jgi:NADPH:quinone reductase-like Zn-dependent oxidoreductase